MLYSTTKRKLHLTWIGYYKYTSDSVSKNVPEDAGVYKISVSQQDDTLKVHYVGQAENLQKRLKEHLNVDSEKNKCLAEHLSKYSCSYKFALVSRQEDRDAAEKALYIHYKPECNDPDAIPNAPDVEINPN